MLFSTRPVFMARIHGRRYTLPMFTGREHGLCSRVVCARVTKMTPVFTARERVPTPVNTVREHGP